MAEQTPAKDLLGCRLVGGVNYPAFITQDAVDKLQSEFEPRESDVFLLTHPKCGTTMIQQMIHLLRNNGDQPDEPMMKGVPWIEKEVTGGLTLEQLEAMPSPRYFKTHASSHLFPAKDWAKAKLLFITRNPKDTAVSLYHHMKNKTAFTFDGTWEEYFQHLMDDNVESSSFFKWHLPWWQRYQSGQCRKALWLHYEDAIQDYPGTVRKVAEFLELQLSDDIINKVAEACTLRAMKSNPKANCNWIPGKGGKEAQHLRKGGAGGWRSVFTVEQNDVYSKRIETELEGSGLHYEYE
eukprot:TRINITY_DN12061_c0_g2_i2.p1 TRINITY_DN12061_c0_g2~~TRINITY_DN12061_c0_g2_i2.p1  ORF type:complete len:305 (+),score=78.13 TRINITY_DN12061_c0_g2_i2:36-917(+)